MEKQNKKLVSIIIPSYNVEEYIRQCVESLLKQTYKNIEIIVVDDGSTDETANIIKTLMDKDERIIYYKKRNGGLSSARNYGIGKASGDFIMFVDGDDYLREDAVEILLKEIEDNDILCFDYYIKVKNNQKIQQAQYSFELNNEKKFLLSQPSACTKFYRKSIFDKNNIKFDEGLLYEDLALIPTLILYTNKIKFISQPLYYYRVRNNSIIHSDEFNIKKDDKFIAIKLLINRFKEKNRYEEFEEEIEYIVIKNLIIAYSTEILQFKDEIYKKRCEKVLENLKKINKKWYKNKYLKKSSKVTRVYVEMFRLKMFFFCKVSLFIKNLKDGGRI